MSVWQFQNRSYWAKESRRLQGCTPGYENLFICFSYNFVHFGIQIWAPSFRPISRCFRQPHRNRSAPSRKWLVRITHPDLSHDSISLSRQGFLKLKILGEITDPYECFCPDRLCYGQPTPGIQNSSSELIAIFHSCQDVLNLLFTCSLTVTQRQSQLVTLPDQCVGDSGGSVTCWVTWYLQKQACVKATVLWMSRILRLVYLEI